MRCLASCNDDEQTPQVVSIVQSGKPPALGSVAETIEGTQGHILFIRHAARCIAQLAAGHPDKTIEIHFPEFLGGILIAPLELLNPVHLSC